MLNKRQAHRRRMIKGAQIVFGDVALEGVVLDLSSTGALICLPSPSEVPETVILRLPDEPDRPARRRWQRGTDIGFEFLSAAE